MENIESSSIAYNSHLITLANLGVGASYNDKQAAVLFFVKNNSVTPQQFSDLIKFVNGKLIAARDRAGNVALRPVVPSIFSRIRRVFSRQDRRVGLIESDPFHSLQLYSEPRLGRDQHFYSEPRLRRDQHLMVAQYILKNNIDAQLAMEIISSLYKNN